jgi:hypothetical protein
MVKRKRRERENIDSKSNSLQFLQFAKDTYHKYMIR